MMTENVEMEIFVDGEDIDTKEFVQNVIGRAIVGAVSTLRGVSDDWQEIDVKVKRK
ncbi:hypothetical protein C5S53_07390 [Methanophagales archaeon]|nr:hypothetical protein C5S53_07390 [Methanophagales archaeon]